MQEYLQSEVVVRRVRKSLERTLASERRASWRIVVGRRVCIFGGRVVWGGV
jgi:hypothetical protein